MRRLFHIICAGLLLAAVSCVSRELEMQPQAEYVTTADGISVKTSALQKGRVRVYVSEQMARRMEADPSSFITENASMGITSVSRTFPYEEEFEKRTRRCGLHRWYDVEFDGDIPLTKAGVSFVGIEGIEKLEYRPKVKRIQAASTGWRHGAQKYGTQRVYAPGELPFNDPGLSGQWNFCNRLTDKDAISGCDINVLPVWENLVSGKSDIIVAVVDGGVDPSHEDLMANLWHNPEQSGNRQYGYNFYDKSYVVTAEDHGTHVGGIIAAVNNNGIGCSSIAGGDAAKGVPGVKLMSCQIFIQGSNQSGNEVSAIKWAADHGAIICQNSWDYSDEVSYIPESVKKAIDYFNEYAGYDSHGNQKGPMGGGLVVFASGNEMTKTPVYPGAYEGVLAVSALDADYTIASYSNYGDWLDLAAPGGDVHEIYSTVPGNKYDWYSGTSMASPHVSGVAALIVANCGGPGFTRNNLVDILLRHTTDISAYNQHRYPGVGLVNASDAIAADTGHARFSIQSFDTETVGHRIRCTVSAAMDNPGDEGSWVTGANIYFSGYPFSSTVGIPYARCIIRENVSGEPFIIETPELDYNRRYYMAIALQDEYGHLSALSPVKSVVTSENLPPSVSGPTGPMEVMAHERLSLEYHLSDPYGDELKATLRSDNGDAVQLIQDGNLVNVYIVGYKSPNGTFSFDIVATDPDGLQGKLTVTYTVLDNHAPVLVKQIEDFILSDNSTVTLDMEEFFSDADGETLSFDVAIDDTLVVKARTKDDGTLVLIPQQYGLANITITAADGLDEKAICSFRMLIRDGSHAVELYPNPVTDGKLYMRTGKPCSVDVTVMNAAGGTVVKETLDAAPFAPASVDMSGCAAGVYNVTTTAAGSTETRKIVKL
ncbi:MAG: S8 family serine peptidase [Bacteroidales bacterium]|nr:S8 family serine peptidase [Bacteroidales bacterium]